MAPELLRIVYNRGLVGLYDFFHFEGRVLSLDIGCGFVDAEVLGNFGKYKASPVGSVNCDVGVPDRRIPNFVRCDGQKLPFRKAEFDFVFLIHVIEHTAHPSDVLAEIRRVMKDSGVLLAETPNVYSLESYRDPNHLWHFTARGLRGLLQVFFGEIRIVGTPEAWAIHNLSRNVSVSFSRMYIVYRVMWHLSRVYELLFNGVPILSANLRVYCRGPTRIAHRDRN